MYRFVMKIKSKVVLWHAREVLSSLRGPMDGIFGSEAPVRHSPGPTRICTRTSQIARTCLDPQAAVRGRRAMKLSIPTSDVAT